MDTSQEYIEMCEKAVKVQNRWKHSKCNSGDWYFHKELNHVYVVTDNEQEDKDCIWLPRQDQLQDMIKIKCNLTFTYMDKEIQLYAVSHLGETGTNHGLGKYYRGTSMEQLWLAFVMKEKYKKVWNGLHKKVWNGLHKEWIKEDK